MFMEVSVYRLYFTFLVMRRLAFEEFLILSLSILIVLTHSFLSDVVRFSSLLKKKILRAIWTYSPLFIYAHM